MLNLDHPQTKHIFAAGRLEDAVLACAKGIVLARERDRQHLLVESEQILGNMRVLNLEHFGNSKFISETIDDLHRRLQNLADANQPRLEIVMPALTMLRSSNGFSTEFI